LYHDINRVNYRHDVFETLGAALAFETVREETCAQHEWRIHGHTIMRDHYHLALGNTGGKSGRGNALAAEDVCYSF
jgi:REP element-mobilizing transposase RayT